MNAEMTELTQEVPVNRLVTSEGLFLNNPDHHNFRTSEELERPVFNAGYVADMEDAIAVELPGEEIEQYIKDNIGNVALKNTTGPGVLATLMQAGLLDRLIIAQVQKTIPIPKQAEKVTVLKEGKVADLIGHGFNLVEEYVQENVTTDDGTSGWTQRYMILESDRLVADRKKVASKTNEKT